MSNSLKNFRFDIARLLNDQVKTQVAKASISTVLDRIRAAKDVTDAQAAPYSAHGPIYIPVVAGFNGGGWKAGRKANRVVGHHQYIGYGVSRRFAGNRNSSGQAIDGYSRTGRSLRFENWQQFKEYLGHSGNRDLEVTGAMLGAVTITETAKDHISIGFEDAKQEMKMKGQQKHADQWGFSPEDRNRIQEAFAKLLSQRASILFS